MADDNSFESRLGRLRFHGVSCHRRYLGRVLAATSLARAGAVGSGLSKGIFSGTRIGRGAGVGRLLASRGGHSATHSRRVIIKASIVKLAGKSASAAAAHLRYLLRDGTTRDGERGALYGRDADVVDGTRLDWMAVDHFYTGHPHTHVVVRSKDDRGADLVVVGVLQQSELRRVAGQLSEEFGRAVIEAVVASRSKASTAAPSPSAMPGSR